MSKEDALALLQELGLPTHIIQHSIAVAEKAVKITRRIQAADHEVNVEVVELGALLHDIGRVRAHGIPHAEYGGEIIRTHGFSDAVARIAETHSLNDLLPEAVEEKIVCYCDKTIKGTQPMSVTARFDLWIRRYGKSQLLTSAKENVLKIEKEISELIGAL